MLADGGIEVVGEADESARSWPRSRRLVARRGRARPRTTGRAELGEQVRAAAPEAKVILWARDETEMEVFEPGSAAPRRVATAVPRRPAQRAQRRVNNDRKGVRCRPI